MKYFPLLLVFLCSKATATSSLSPMAGDNALAPTSSKEQKKGLPGDKAYPSLQEQVEESRKILTQKEVIHNSNGQEQEEVPQAPKPSAQSKPPEQIRQVEKQQAEQQPSSTQPPTRTKKPARKVVQTKKRDIFLPGTGVTVFPDNFEDWSDDVILVPALSSALATVQGGEEVTMRPEEWVSAKLDYAFLGANGRVVELNGCLVKILLRGNFNTSKVKGTLEYISCTSPNGVPFKRNIRGKIISAATEYGGVDSEVIMAGPSKGIALEALQSAIKGFGQAMAFTETTRNAVAGEYSSREVTNVTGNSSRYVGAKVLESSGDFLNYLVDFYKGLQPTLAIAPGTKVHVIIDGELEIPGDFFKSSHDINSIGQEILKR